MQSCGAIKQTTSDFKLLMFITDDDDKFIKEIFFPSLTRFYFISFYILHMREPIHKKSGTFGGDYQL